MRYVAIVNADNKLIGAFDTFRGGAEGTAYAPEYQNEVDIAAGQLWELQGGVSVPIAPGDTSGPYDFLNASLTQAPASIPVAPEVAEFQTATYGPVLLPQTIPPAETETGGISLPALSPMAWALIAVTGLLLLRR